MPCRACSGNDINAGSPHFRKESNAGPCQPARFRALTRPVPGDSVLQVVDMWSECLRILAPSGRIACVVGDVCISRRVGGRHHVLPLSADLQVRARKKILWGKGRKLGFDCLTPIRWMKVSNIRLEDWRSARFLGKPTGLTASSKTTSSTSCSFGSRAVTGNLPRKWKGSRASRPTITPSGLPRPIRGEEPALSASTYRLSDSKMSIGDGGYHIASQEPLLK